MIGITEAANALEAARDLLEAEQVTATACSSPSMA